MGKPAILAREGEKETREGRQSPTLSPKAAERGTRRMLGWAARHPTQLSFARSGADLRKYGVHHVEGVRRGEDFLQLLFELGLGFDLADSIQICQCQRIKVDEVRDVEQLEFVARAFLI